MTSADYDSLYALACELCDEDKFKDALAIALQLAIHQPQQARYSFLAASCFHRLGLVQPAVSLYGICLMCEKEPITTFRMGECFGALGDKERAQEAFDLTFEMCRGESEYYHLQKQAEEALEKLKLN
jgi:tetratricopeptide (TPR) repeat protein